MSKLVKGIILAAGRGSRMGPLTDEKPKCMVEFQGRPLIEKQIESLRSAGIEDIGIICGYKAELLSPYSSHIFINPKWESTNMLFSLLIAKEWLLNYPCIVSYSDIFYEPQIIKDLISNVDETSISYDPYWLKLWEARFDDPLDDAETFKLKEHDYLKEIGNKPKSLDDVEGQYMGLLKFHPSFWEKSEKYIGDIDPKISMTEFINFCLSEGFEFKAIKNSEPWGEIDSVSDLKFYQTAENK